MVWPRRHVSSLLKGLHQAPPACPPCAQPAPPPGRRHVLMAEAGAGRVAAAHEAPAGGRGSGVGGARGGAGGSEDLPMSRTLRFCSDLHRWSQEGGLMPARASSCASLITPWGEFLQTAAGPPSGCFLIATTVGWLLGPPRFPVPSAPRLHTVSPGPKQPLLLDFCLLTLRKRSCACSECALHAAVAARVEGSTRRRGVGSA